MMIIGGSRLYVRWLLLVFNVNTNLLNQNNVLIYGAGSAGTQLSTALSESKDYKPVAFIDDSSKLLHRSINGIDVFSQTDLDGLIDSEDSDEYGTPKEGAMRIALDKVSKRIINEITSTW